MTEKFSPGMKELGEIVAGLYKDVKLRKEGSWLGGAQKYASKHKEWTAAAEDIIGPRGVPDGVDEIVVRDKKGNVRVINGYTLKPSQYALRQAYYSDVPRWDDAALNAAGIKEPARRRARMGRPTTPMKEFKRKLYEYAPEFMADENGMTEYTGRWNLTPYPNLTSKASNYLRQSNNISPRKLLQQFYKQIWDSVKRSLYVTDENGKVRPMYEAQTMLAIYSAWFNNEYLNFVVIPTFERLRIPFDPENPTKGTQTRAFKDMALNVLAHMDIRDVGNDVAGRLQAIINDVKSGTTPNAAAAKIYQFIKLPSSRQTPIQEDEEATD